LSEFFDWNPARGSWYETEDDHQSGGIVIHTKQDVQPSLDWAKKQRNSGHNDLGGLRDGGDLKHYATIPAGIELEMLDKGLDIHDRHNIKRLIHEIERNYPLCKVTNRKMI
jgi:hypothetical protein